MSFSVNHAYNDAVKAALMASVQDHCDYLVYLDAEGGYRFIRAEKGRLVIPCDNAKYLGWTEFSIEGDIPTARYFEFETPLTAEALTHW